MAGPHDTLGSVTEALAELGAQALVRTLAQLQEEGGGLPPPTPQPEAGVTYAQKVLKSDARLDWARAAPELEAAVRAFNPRPVAHGEPMHGRRAR